MKTVSQLPKRVQRVVLQRAPWADLDTPLYQCFVFAHQPEGEEYWARLAASPQPWWGALGESKHSRSTLVFAIAAVLFAYVLHVKDEQTWARYKAAHNCEQSQTDPARWECDNNTTISRPL